VLAQEVEYLIGLNDAATLSGRYPISASQPMFENAVTVSASQPVASVPDLCEDLANGQVPGVSEVERNRRSRQQTYLQKKQPWRHEQKRLCASRSKPINPPVF
jgi:hypothetical protein